MNVLYIYAEWNTAEAYIVAQNWEKINVTEWVLEMWDDWFIIKLKPNWKTVDLPLPWVYDDNKFSVINIAKAIFEK